MKKFEGKSNAYGKIIKKYRKSKNMSRADVSRELDLIDIPINLDELYRIERQNMILKDYEPILFYYCEFIVPNSHLRTLYK